VSARLAAAAWAAGAAWAAAPIDRDSAREAAERELSKGAYHVDDPGLLRRLGERALDWLDQRLADLTGVTPGGSAGLVVLALAAVALAWLALWRLGPLRRTPTSAAVLPAGDGALSAAGYRRQADGFAAAGRYADAVRARMRAIARELEARGVLEPRAGRTADEIAREAGAQVPAVAGPLRTAAALFDEVWYGGRPATAGHDAALRQADDEVRRAPLAAAR